MHTEVTESALIEAPLETIWSLYDDPEALRRWAPNVLDAHVVEGGKKRLGSYVRTRLRVTGIEQSLEEQVTRYQPPRRCSVSGEMPGWRYSISLDLDVTSTGTRCVYSCASDYAFPLVPLVPFLERMNARMLRDALAALKRAAEPR